MNMLMLVALLVGQITVSDRLPLPVKYPAAVYDMTDAQFAQWAIGFNKMQDADLEKRRVKMTEPQYITGMETTRENHWYGNSDQIFSDYGNWSTGDYYGNSDHRTTTYVRRWHNPLHTGPGPLVNVNPYCKPAK